MQFIGSNDPSYIRDPCNKILADDTLDNKFLTTYLKRMGWVGYSEDNLVGCDLIDFSHEPLSMTDESKRSLLIDIS